MATLDRKTIISLTSYSTRINTVHKVIDSLKKQTEGIEKIILWLDEDETSLEKLPKELNDLTDDKFEVKFCPNFKSYKKLIPSIKQYPDYNIITFDDDLTIPPGTIEKFLEAHKRNPDHIIATRGRIMLKDRNSDLTPYKEWKLLSNRYPVFANDCILPIGCGGVLYPSGSLDTRVIDSESFMTLADNADDIWFKAMGLLKRTKTVILPRKISSKYKEIESTQDIALYLNVNNDNRNLECLNSIIKNYPELDKIINAEDFDFISMKNRDIEAPLSISNLFSSKNDAIDFFRDTAILLESKNIKSALKLMTIAKKFRPNGPLINNKINEYKKKVAQDK